MSTVYQKISVRGFCSISSEGKISAKGFELRTFPEYSGIRRHASLFVEYLDASHLLCSAVTQY